MTGKARPRTIPVALLREILAEVAKETQPRTKRIEPGWTPRAIGDVITTYSRDIHEDDSIRAIRCHLDRYERDLAALNEAAAIALLHHLKDVDGNVERHDEMITNFLAKDPDDEWTQNDAAKERAVLYPFRRMVWRAARALRRATDKKR